MRLGLALRGLSLAAATFAFAAGDVAADMPPAKAEGVLRLAMFNVNLARGSAGKLIDDFRNLPDGELKPRIDAVVRIIQRVRPDVLVLAELDYDPAGEALALFEAELKLGRDGAQPIIYPHRFQAPVNTGLRTGLDLDGDGKTNGPADAQGWGVFEGQFGMAVLSALPLDAAPARTFQSVLWRDVPWAAAPTRPDGAPYFSAEAWSILRLSSKSHWDVAARTPSGAPLHLLVSHPTPPVFDGPEDKNGLRNAAEIRFWRDYIARETWMRDDAGNSGGLPDGAAFTIFGDLNADPADGDGVNSEIAALLADPMLQDPQPKSAGAAEATRAQGGENARHRGDPALDTADWKDAGRRAPGNLRVDYVLPSAGLTVLGSGVFWPQTGGDGAALVRADEKRRPVGSDHRLVWVDIQAP